MANALAPRVSDGESVRSVESQRANQSIRHNAWRTVDGALSAAPLMVAQTSDGYVWVKTEFGLLRFDGTRFVPFDSLYDAKLRSNSVSVVRRFRRQPLDWDEVGNRQDAEGTFDVVSLDWSGQ